jgi:glycosyltransferase involved in cell wall biosynthesis
MKKLAIFTASDLRSFGGPEKNSMSWANKLIELGWTVAIFSHKTNTKHRMSLKHIRKMTKAKIIWYKSFKIPVLLDNLPSLSGLPIIDQVRDYDVIYNMDPSLATMYLLINAAKKYKIRLIMGIHAPFLFRDKPKVQSTLRNAAMPAYAKVRNNLICKIPNIMVETDADKEGLRKIGYKGKIYKIEPHAFDRIALKTNDVKNKEFVALFVGRLNVRDKGLDFLERIIANVLSKNKTIRFHIVGSGEDGSPLVESLVNKYPENVKHLGFVTESQLSKEYKKASVFLFPSRGENFSIGIAEAKGYGLPFIGFKVPGVADALANPIQGKIIKAFDTDAFSRALLDYYNSWSSNKKQYLQTRFRISKEAQLVHGLDVVARKKEKMFLGE